MIPRNERATRHEQHGMLPETTRMGIIQDKRNAKKHHEWDREKFHVLYACFLLAALGDDVYHVTHVVQFDDVVKFETKSPFLFHVTDDSHVGERVPPSTSSADMLSSSCKYFSLSTFAKISFSALSTSSLSML